MMMWTVLVLFSVVAGTLCGMWSFMLVAESRWAIIVSVGVGFSVSAFVLAASGGWSLP